MWILPKNLHISLSAQVTEGLTLDLNESSQICAQSLFVRSKPSPARTWSQKWKRDCWTQHLSGRILKPSHGASFVTEWTSYLAAIHASRLVPQESDLEPTTSATSGRSSAMEFSEWLPESASWKMSKDTSRWDSPQSLVIWKKWVTKSRGEYSQRLSAVRRTSESGCLSWPTVTANEDSYRIGGDSQQSKCLSAMARRGEMSGPAAPVSPSTNGSRQGYLSPAWTETLMGLPIGWTDCASLETESCQQPQH